MLMCVLNKKKSLIFQPPVVTIKTNKVCKQMDTLSTHQHNGTKLFLPRPKTLCCLIVALVATVSRAEPGWASAGKDDSEREEDCSMWMCLGWNARYAMSDSQLRFDQPTPRCIGTGSKDLCGFYWLEAVMDGSSSVQRLVCPAWRRGPRAPPWPISRHRLCIRYENMRLSVGVSCCHDPI